MVCLYPRTSLLRSGWCASASSFLTALKVRKIVRKEKEIFPKVFFWTIIEAY